MLVLCPEHIVLFPLTAATGNGFTVTVTVFELEQPVAVTVSVNVYVVLIVGDTDGFELVELKPDGLDVQEYVFPETAEAPMVVLLPRQTDLFNPAFAKGNGFTVTVTVFELEHPVEVFVSVKV